MPQANEKSLRSILISMLGSYVQRDQSVAFSDWLADKLNKEMPGISPESSKELTKAIVAAVADYDRALDELNQAIEGGRSKEEWLASRLEEIYVEMPPEIAGERLQMLGDNLAASNAELMGEAEELLTDDGAMAEEPVSWNKYSLKQKTREIADQVSLLGMSAAADALSFPKLQEDEVNQLTGQAIKSNAKHEVKAVVAGAVRSAAGSGLIEHMPEDVPLGTICDVAGAAVEGAEALMDAAAGDITMTDALDKVARAGVAAGCRFGAMALEGLLLALPYGSVLASLFSGLLEHMRSSQFLNNVYTVVRDAAVATWQGMKNTVKGLVNRVKTILFN